MEFMLVLTIFIFALCFLLYMATKFIKELKSGKTTKLSNGFEACLSINPISNKKSEVNASNVNFTSNKLG